jgi:hypothetical protein
MTSSKILAGEKGGKEKGGRREKGGANNKIVSRYHYHYHITTITDHYLNGS